MPSYPMLKLIKERQSGSKKQVKPKEAVGPASDKKEGKSTKKKDNLNTKVPKKSKRARNDEDKTKRKKSLIDKEFAKSLLKRTLQALAPVLIPVFYSCVFIPLNNVMSGDPVSEAEILQTLMAMWIAVIVIAFLTDRKLSNFFLADLLYAY